MFGQALIMLPLLLKIMPSEHAVYAAFANLLTFARLAVVPEVVCKAYAEVATYNILLVVAH